MRQYTLALYVLLLTGCMGGGGSGDVPIPPPEYYAIQDYERIATNANLLLSTDRINWIPDQAEPERVSVECLGMYCSVGYSAFIHSDKVIGLSVDDLSVLSTVQGINTGVVEFSSPWSNLHSYGGWMKHSFFASTAVMWVNDLDPDQGVVQAYGTVTGNSMSTNPTMEATWTGFVTAKDHNVATDLTSVVTGDARISVSIDEQVLVDVHLTDMVNDMTSQSYTDMIYEGMPATDDQFGRYHADDDKVSGVFYGPNHEEVGGVFDHPEGLAGAYGGKRKD